MKTDFHCRLIIPLLFILFPLVLLCGCTKTDEGITEDAAGQFGTIIPIPDMNVSVVGDFASDLKTTNEGIYMLVNKASSANPWIYRLQNSGPTASWIFHEQPNLYFDWEPSSYRYEKPETFAIYFQTIDKNGFVNINTGLPALLEENNPPNGGLSFTGEMLYDNSPSARKWAFFGSTVKVKQNNNSNKYDNVCTLPPGGIQFAEAEPWDAIVWAAAGNKLYKITINGVVTTFDVSGYNDPSSMVESIAKIRFSQDVLHKDVYFRYQNKVFRITDGKTMSLFYTIKNESNFLGGDFAIDASNLYATDGIKKRLDLSTETNFIPEPPGISNQEAYLNYLTCVSALNTGPIEVLQNPTDNFIYVIYQDKLIKMPKSIK